MPGWYFSKKELKNTPSIMKGLDYKTEMRYRKEGAQFIISVGKEMKLGYNTTATGVVYFHRFYMFHSFQEFPKYVTACCCILLAGKVEETPKKCRDIIEKAKNLLSDHKFATFGIDPKEEVVTLERVLLQTIKFDLQVEHPYQFLLKYAKYLKGDKAKLEKMVQMAWTFVNDSLCTTLCLQWEPEIIAVALMYLAGKLSKFEVLDWSGRNPKHLRWWDMFVEDMTMDLLEDICHQVLDLYSQPAGEGKSPSPPPMQAIKGPKLTPPKQGGVALPPSDKQSLAQPPDVSMMPPPPLNNPKLPPQPPPMNEVPPLQYQTFTHAPPLPMAPYGNAVRFAAGVVTTAVNTPPPPLGGPPPPPNVFAPFVGHPPPPPFSTVVPPPPTGAPPYYGSGGMPPPPPGPLPPHRPFYQSQ